MDITLNLQPFLDLMALPTDQMVWRIFVTVGWMPIVMAFLYGAKESWLYYINEYIFSPSVKSTFIAIDIPRGNEQSPRAVENIFAHLAGVHMTFNLLETYWLGMSQLGFSLEIVSLEGYTQFIIKTPIKYRDLLEAAIYSQYPDAEITEVEDYAKATGTPAKFPDEEWDMWGAEYTQLKPSCYPIRTYEEFEHSLGKDGVQFKDPMASLMDICSSVGKGEQFLMQIVIKPEGFDWPKEGDKEIRKILGEKQPESFGNGFVDMLMDWLGEFREAIYSIWGEIEEKKKEEKDDTLKMMNLRPKEKKQIEAIQKKISKMGYKFKLRMIYLSKKGLMNKPKVVYAFTGFLKQFGDLDLNQLKPDMELTATTSSYLFKDAEKDRRRNKLITRYRDRDTGAGRTPGILNNEELATLWHFPLESAVKAPMIQKTPGRKAQAPMTLPISEEIVAEEILEPLFEDVDHQKKKQDALNKAPIEAQENFWETEIENNSLESTDNKNGNSGRGTPPPNLPFA